MFNEERAVQYQQGQVHKKVFTLIRAHYTHDYITMTEQILYLVFSISILRK